MKPPTAPTTAPSAAPNAVAIAPPRSAPSGIVPQTIKRIDRVHPALEPLGRDRLAQADLRML